MQPVMGEGRSTMAFSRQGPEVLSVLERTCMHNEGLSYSQMKH